MKYEIEDSDLEFWQDLEKEPTLNKQLLTPSPSKFELSYAKTANFLRENEKIPKEIEKTLITPSSIKWIKDYFQEKINNIRESQEPEIQISKIIIKNHAKRDYDLKLKNVIEKYQSDFRNLIFEFSTLRRIITIKDEEIGFLIQILSEIHLYMMGKRLKLGKGSEKNEEMKKLEQENLALAEEVQGIRSQILYYKELFAVLKDETEKAKKKLHETQNQQIQQEMQYAEEIKHLNESHMLEIKQFLNREFMKNTE